MLVMFLWSSTNTTLLTVSATDGSSRGWITEKWSEMDQYRRLILVRTSTLFQVARFEIKLITILSSSTKQYYFGSVSNHRLVIEISWWSNFWTISAPQTNAYEPPDQEQVIRLANTNLRFIQWRSDHLLISSTRCPLHPASVNGKPIATHIRTCSESTASSNAITPNMWGHGTFFSLFSVS